MEIFQVRKVRYDQPGESKEQECLFVEIQSARNLIRQGTEISKVTGTGVIFGNAEKIPFGFFSKQIERASQDLTKNLFFYDFEENALLYENIVGRSFSFVYFFKNQYDPEQGQITSVVTTVEEQ